MTPNKEQHRLFVEGHTDGAVVNKLIRLRLGLDLAQEQSRIVDVPSGEGGVTEACRRFAASLAAERPTRLGLLVDRDGTPDRWNSVRGILVKQGIDVPHQPPASGVRIETSWGRVGVWLMPDNVSAGDLETFLEGLLPQPPPATWTHAETATQEAKRLGAPFKDPHARKARFHTWLAWNDPPGHPYGTAIQTGALGFKSVAADAFVEWFEWLFG